MFLLHSARTSLSVTLLSIALAACAAPAAHVALPPASPSGATRPLDAADRAWVERTLASMSLRDKAGQMIMPWIGGDYVAADSPELERLAQWVERDGVGGVVISVGMPLSYATKLNALQRRARVPLLVASDMENGPGMRMAGIYSFPHLLPQGGGTNFPATMAVGATGSDTLAWEVGRVLAREARAVGVHVTFGPVLDVNSNPLNPIINTRSYGEDPASVARLASAYIRGAHEGGLMVTGKHFPGHGDTEVDSHIDLPVIPADRARLDAVELAPYRMVLGGAGLDGVMTAHIAVIGIEGRDARPATLSPYFITDVLRGDLSFRGLVYTDAMDMGAIANRFGAEEALLLAIEAGADVLLMPRDVTQAVETVVAGVESGRIAESRLDVSVRRLLEAKARAGLRSERLVDVDAVERSVGTRAHAEAAQRIAERSITLARDDRGLVPLAASASRVLLLTYAGANDPIAGRVFAGALRSSGRDVQVVRVDARTTQSELDSLRVRAAAVDVVIAATFVTPVEGTGTIEAGGGFTGLVQALSADGRPLIAVSFGSPYVVTSFDAVPAYMLAYGGQEASQTAAARALAGQASITGRLPVSIPPLFALGGGLRREATAAGTP
ncbi:MAG TPA: glycoside hydrolase family 3 protein [Gemmatimonadaceae bacterium]|nr:glycoside hydrolase family 3 protein [Gemmatimonadaceae bacterium]